MLDPDPEHTLQVTWIDPESGECFRCTRRSFVCWLHSTRKAVIERASDSRLNGERVARRLRMQAEMALMAAKAAEAAAKRLELDREGRE